jgi:hypothetical protein
MTTTTKAYSTGGELNTINEKYRCNSKSKSVPVMQLIREHKPNTNDELVALIKTHTKDGIHNNCKCGCKSAGTIKDFGKNLYNANVKHFCELGDCSAAKSLEECELFMYTLFVTNSLKGNNMENKALKELNKTGLIYHKIEIASEDCDFKYGVDLVAIDKNGDEVCGIQVKPISYKMLPQDHQVRAINNKKNEDYGKPVFYLYYDATLVFTNIKETIESINKHIESLENPTA